MGKLKFYKTMVVPAFLYGSKGRLLKQAVWRQIQFSEIIFLRTVREYRKADCIHNTQIWKELGILQIRDKIKYYKPCWKEHIIRMEEGQLQWLIIGYNPQGIRVWVVLGRDEVYNWNMPECLPHDGWWRQKNSLKSKCLLM